jgi:hypothetical protein
MPQMMEEHFKFTFSFCDYCTWNDGRQVKDELERAGNDPEDGGFQGVIYYCLQL